MAAPAFADVTYIGTGGFDVETLTGADGQFCPVPQTGKTYTEPGRKDS
jgi:hypothetical protein